MNFLTGNQPSRTCCIAGLLAALYLVLVLPPLPTTGLTYDEPTYMNAARDYGLYVHRISQGAPPFSKSTLDLWSTNPEHPPLVKLVSAATRGTGALLKPGNLSFTETIAAHRLGGILFALVGLLIVHRFGWEGWTPRVGLAAALSLIFLPRFLGHSRFLALDVPMAVMWLAVTYCFWRSGRDSSWSVWTGVVFGLALATKLNALFIPAALVGWIAVVGFHEVFRTDVAGRGLSRRLVPYLRSLFAMALVSPVVLYLIWPRLWLHPLEAFGEYLAFHARHFAVPVHYMGTTYQLGAPWHYPFVMLAITVPLGLLLLAFVGTAQALRDLVIDPERPSVLVLISAAFSVLVLATSPLKYDGIRLMMPALPFLALLAGLGADRTWGRLVSLLDASRRVGTGIYVALLGLIVLPGLWVHVRQAPYEYVFYNALVGGERGALERGFELDYWAQSYRELVPPLNRWARTRERLTVYPAAGRSFRCELLRVYRNGTPGPGSSRSHGGPLSNNVRCVDRPDEADLIVVLSRPGLTDNRSWTLFREGEARFEFGLPDAPLVRVFDR